MIDLERHVKPSKEISLVPLINIIFLLLTFFMVAGSLQKWEVLPVDPPIALSGEELNQGSIVIVLGRYGELLFNDELTRLEQLIPMIEAQLRVNPKRVITIKADGRVKAGAMIHVLEKIRAAGGVNLTLATQAP